MNMPESSSIDSAVIELLRQVRTAQEQAITDQAQMDIEHDGLLNEAADYPGILAQEALSLGKRMMYLARHPRIAPWIGQRVATPEVRLILLGGTGQNNEQRRKERVMRAYNAADRARQTRLLTPLMFESEAEHVDGAALVHGWYFELLAFGGQDINEHTPRTIVIKDRIYDKESGFGQDTRSHVIALEPESITRANLYIKYPPFRPFPAVHNTAHPDETYLLPIGLLHAARRALTTKSLRPK